MNYKCSCCEVLKEKVSDMYRIKFKKRPTENQATFIITTLDIPENISSKGLSFLFDEHVRVGSDGECVLVQQPYWNVVL